MILLIAWLVEGAKFVFQKLIFNNTKTALQSLHSNSPTLWAISFHAMVVFGLGKSLLFKSNLGRCAYEL